MLSLFSCRTTKEVKHIHSATFIKNFHEGVRLKLNNEVNAAIEKFNACLKEDEVDDASHFALSQLYLMNDDLQNAAIHTKKASELDPKNQYYQTELAFMLQELQEYDKAAQIFDKLAKENLQNPMFYYGSFENWAKAANTDKAILTLNNLEKFVGSSPEISVKKFELLLKANKEKEGLEIILAAKKKFPEDASIIAHLVDYYMQRKQYSTGMKMLQELVLKDPDNGMALLMLGEIEMQNGDEISGLKHLKEAVHSEGITIDQKMEVLISIQNFKKSDPEMESLVNFMVARYPKEAKAHSIRGDYFFKENKLLIATESYKNAVKCDPNLYPIWNQILLLEYQNQWYDSLNVDSEKCLEYFPVQPLPYFLNGVSKVQKKQYVQAIARLQEGLDLLLNDVAMEAEIYSQMGEAYFGLKDLEKGKLFYEKSISKQPSSLFLKNNYAYRLALHNTDLDKAEKLINDILEVAPEDARYMDTKGWILFMKGKYSLANEFFGKAYLGLPNDKIIVEHLGDAAIKLGQKEKAIEYWQKARELGSTNLNLEKKITNKVYYDPIY